MKQVVFAVTFVAFLGLIAIPLWQAPRDHSGSTMANSILEAQLGLGSGMKRLAVAKDCPQNQSYSTSDDSTYTAVCSATFNLPRKANILILGMWNARTSGERGEFSYAQLVIPGHLVGGNLVYDKGTGGLSAGPIEVFGALPAGGPYRVVAQVATDSGQILDLNTCHFEVFELG